MGIRLGIEENVIHRDVLDVSRRAEPRAWARKYFTAPSVSWLFLVCITIGINLRRLSSMAPHKRIQFALDRAISVLTTRDRDVNTIIGEYTMFMKIMEELNPLIRIRSSYVSRLIYMDQSREPSFHSWINPNSRISKNETNVTNVTPRLQVIIMVGIGIRRTISISNTIKMMARRKNRIEKGMRAVLLGSNPHSNGEDFSRSV